MTHRIKPRRIVSRAGLWRQLSAVFALILLLTLLGGGLRAAPAAAQDELTDAERRDIELLLNLVRAKDIDMTWRRQAVRSLLDREADEAASVLIAELTPGGDESTQRAIAQAIAQRPEEPPKEFDEALLALLSRAEETLLPDVAAALGRYPESNVSRKVTALALNRKAEQRPRVGATLAIGLYHNRRGAETLIKLIDEGEPAAVRAAAFESLETLTGIESYGDDAEKWRRWWQQHSKLREEAFVSRLAGSFARRNDRLSAEQQQLQKRLIEALEQAYRATDKKDRQALLVRMVKDNLAAVRQLAMKLTEDLLVANEPIGDELRAALRDRLDDAAAEVRERSAVVLMNLRDETAADTVVRRLVAGKEANTSVLRASLLMMTRLPRAAVIDTTIQMLRNPGVQNEAAAVLVAGLDAGLADEQQRQRINDMVDRLTTADRPPTPRLIELLGRVGDDEDWKRIAGWLDHEDAAVRTAAARAWASSQRSVLPLVERLSDAVIAPIAVAAAADRGRDEQAFALLVRYTPPDATAVQTHRRALVGMAGRLPLAKVIDAADELAAAGASAALRRVMLSAAIDPLLTNGQSEKPDPAVLAALLRRGEAALEAGDPRAASADLDRVASLEVSKSDDIERRARELTLQVQLASGEMDAAVEHARKWLAVTGDGAAIDGVRQTIADAFVKAAHAASAAKDYKRVDTVIEGLTGLMGDALPDSAKQAIAKLREEAAAPGNGDTSGST